LRVNVGPGASSWARHGSYHLAEPDYCVRIRSKLLWAAKSCLGKGFGFSNPIAFSKKTPVDLNISKHKNETIPFL
jgi:hypothetical protein